AILVAVVLFAYALVTGGRPPAMRAAVTVLVLCGGVIFRRPTTPANDFALAWLVVALIDPSDMFSPGCQLSFLSVAVLFWGASRWFRWEWFRQPDALDLLVDQTRPWWLRTLRWLAWVLLSTYAVTAIIWLAIVPLLVYHYHLVPIIALLIGPPVAVLTSAALILGFLLLLIAAVWPPLALPLVWLTHVPLWLCAKLVDWA